MSARNTGDIYPRGSTPLRSVALVLATGWTFVVLTAAVRIAHVEAEEVYFGDFGRFYYSTEQAVGGGEMYGPVPASYRAPAHALRQQTDLNPPHFHVALLPLVSLSLPTAWRVWQALGLMALAWSAWATMRHLHLRVTPKRAYVIAVALASSMAVVTWIFTAQLTLLMLVPMTLAWFAAREGRWTAAGAWMGVCWSVKPFLGLFAVYFALSRRWGALLSGIASTAIAFLVGVALFGIDAHRGWIEDLLAVTWAAHERNGSLMGLLAKAFTGAPQYAAVAVQPVLTSVLWLIGSAALISAFVAVSVRDDSVNRQWLVVLLASLLISPLGWLYYTCWLFGPALVAWRQSCRRRTTALVAMSTWWVPWPVTFIGQPSALATVTIGSLYSWGLLVLFGLSVLDSRDSNQ
jgi:hypothetical protein